MAFYWPHHCIDALLASFLDRLKYEFFWNVSLSIYVSSWKQIKHILLQVNLVICIPYKTTKQQAHGHSAREPVIKMERDGQWHCLETREETLENYKVYHCYCFCHVITITSSKCWIVFWYFFRSVINNANAYTCWHERSADGLLKLKRIFLNSFDKSLYVMKMYVRSYYISFWVSREGKVAAKRDFIKDIINWFFLILLNTSDSKMQFLLFICFAFFNCFFSQDVKFAVGEVNTLGKMAVFSRLRRDYSTVSKRGGKVTSSYDQRISLTVPKGCIDGKDHIVMEV